ncbi:MAG: hypothetical protein PHZ09_05250 [Eubacteriales bacterium]|nr:hypothetical protein [Eubacteriales bacterium]
MKKQTAVSAALVIIVTGVVFAGVFLIFAQFNTGSIQSDFITHTADSDIR